MSLVEQHLNARPQSGKLLGLALDELGDDLANLDNRCIAKLA